MKTIKLSEAQLDALREIGTIGAGHASTALSQMTMKKIMISVPNAYLTPVEKIPEIVGGPEEPVVGIFFKIFGDIEGQVFLVFTREQALNLSNTLLGKEGDPEFLTDEKESAIKELCNIMTSSYLNALGAMVGMTLIPSVPHLSYDMAGVVLDPLIVELGQKTEGALIIETEFSTALESSAGRFFVFYIPKSLDMILKALGMQDK